MFTAQLTFFQELVALLALVSFHKCLFHLYVGHDNECVQQCHRFTCVKHTELNIKVFTYSFIEQN